MESPQYPDQQNRAAASLSAEIQSQMLTFLIAAGICLYFGFSWLIDAPGSAGAEATKTWFAIDMAFRWCLRVVGAVFLIAAALAPTGQPFALLPALAAEGAFTLLMIVMGIETTLEARADGHFDAFVILFLILAIVGVSSVKRLWTLWREATRAAAPPAD
jgi:hypothetical protein